MADIKEYPEEFTEFSLDEIDDENLQEIKDELAEMRKNKEIAEWEVFI